jgi:ribose 1,5-bisphosphokinase
MARVGGIGMRGGLLYVTGPSGAGKDSVLAWLRAHLPADAPVHWARRSITRPVEAGGEANEALAPADWTAVLAAGGFALHWEANGLRYGIRVQELAPLAQGAWVVVNGSRAHVDEARRLAPRLVVLHVTAPRAVLAQRLRARGRESEAEIARRLDRAEALGAPAGALVVCNDGPLEAAGRAALQALAAVPG